jgi:hypothetical protein
MPKDIEILPPERVQVEKPRSVTVTARVPSVRTYGAFVGAIEAHFDEGRYNRSSKVADALTRLNDSEARLFTSQGKTVEAYTQLQDRLYDLQELPEKRGHQLAVQRAHRAMEIREVRHRIEKQELRCSTEIQHLQTDLTKARAEYTRADTDYIDAKQQRSAQIKHGMLGYEIAHIQQNVQRLNIELSKKERKALMRGQLKELEEQGRDDDDEQEIRQKIRGLMNEYKQIKSSAGLDTSEIDDVLSRGRK